MVDLVKTLAAEDGGALSDEACSGDASRKDAVSLTTNKQRSHAARHSNETLAARGLPPGAHRFVRNLAQAEGLAKQQ